MMKNRLDHSYTNIKRTNYIMKNDLPRSQISPQKGKSLNRCSAMAKASAIGKIMLSSEIRDQRCLKHPVLVLKLIHKQHGPTNKMSEM